MYWKLKDHFPLPRSLPQCRVACTNLDPVEVVKKVKELCQRLVVVPGEDGLSKEAQRNATVMFLSLMRSHLASKRLLKVCGGGQGVRGCEGEGGRVCVEGAFQGSAAERD